MRCLHDPSGRVVNSAVWALGELRDPRAVEPILALLANSHKLGHRDEGVRGSAAEALGKLGDPRAYEPLLAAYKEYSDKKSGDRYLRDTSLEALGRTKDPRAFDVLGRALKDEDVWERVAAVWGLARLGDDRSLALLKRA